MKTAKQELIEVLERLPDDASVETLLQDVYVQATLIQRPSNMNSSSAANDMNSPKEQTRELLARLPDDVPMDTLVYHLDVIASIRRGMDQARRGEWITDEELGERLKRWAESSGRRKLSEI